MMRDEGDELRIDCLDHGFVRLVDWMGGDISISRAARVSYDAAWRAGEDEGSDAKLINFLWRNHHTSPFEAVALTFEVKAPIFVFRQWHRHRTQSYNELSARYRELPEEFYIPDVEKIGLQSINNKQGRTLEGADVSGLRQAEIELLASHCGGAFEVYRQLRSTDWPRELARSVLPVNTYSHMFVTMNLLNLFRFLTLRDDEHAQYEIRVYAHALRALARSVAPVAVGAWEKARQQEVEQRERAKQMSTVEAWVDKMMPDWNVGFRNRFEALEGILLSSKYGAALAAGSDDAQNDRS